MAVVPLTEFSVSLPTHRWERVIRLLQQEIAEPVAIMDSIRDQVKAQAAVRAVQQTTQAPATGAEPAPSPTPSPPAQPPPAPVVARRLRSNSGNSGHPAPTPAHGRGE